MDFNHINFMKDEIREMRRNNKLLLARQFNLLENKEDIKITKTMIIVPELYTMKYIENMIKIKIIYLDQS